MLDSFTQFWFSHLNSIVNVLFLVLILLFLILFVVIFISSRSRKESEIHSDELESTLRRVLESAELKAAPMPIATGTADVSAEASQEVANLKKSVNDKNAEIETLKQQIAEKSSGEKPEDVSGLQLRLKELEAKLSEYEVIEDDIANLSLYKEENKRLRDELDKMQTTSPNTASSPTEEIPEEFKQAVDEQIQNYNKDTGDEIPPAPPLTVTATDTKVEAELPPAVPAAPAATASTEEDDDIMSEFVQAVAEQGSKEKPKVEVATTPASTPSAKPEPVAAPTPAKDPTDEIMAEFEAAAVEKEKVVSTADEVFKEDTDTDKILNEMDSLLSATNKNTADQEAEDPTKKLIDEFESLTKG